MLWKLQAAMATRSALETTLQELDAKRFAQMKLYQAAHSDHETMLNLQRDQRAAYELRQARVEQKFLDDIFMARRHRS
jgi:hypothetical protein